MTSSLWVQALSVVPSRGGSPCRVRELVVEKSEDILAGASEANSARLHTGFDAPPGSMAHSCICAGYEEYQQIRDSFNLATLETGALLVAWTLAEAEQLLATQEQARSNGVSDRSLLTARQLAAREPQLDASAIAALHIPGESVIDPWTSPYLYRLQAIENGTKLWRQTEITGGRFEAEEWLLESSRGPCDRAGTSVCTCFGGTRLPALG